MLLFSSVSENWIICKHSFECPTVCLHFSKTSFAGAVLEGAALLHYQQLQGLSDIREAGEVGPWSWTVLLEAKRPFTMVQLRQRPPFSHLYFRKVSIGLFLEENYRFQEIKFVLSKRFMALHYISLKTWHQSCLMNVAFWRRVRLALWFTGWSWRSW